MESERSIRAQRLDAWIDIAIGLVISVIYASVLLTMNGIELPVITVPGLVGVASVVANSSAPTQGDWTIIVLVASYAEFWAIRLVSKAITTLRYTPALTIPESSGKQPAKV